ncbi:peptidoglycan-binding domain-containing protein [Paenibacillus sp. FSL M7-0802]|nr:peptidoglycan-binding domain-containing protein [Paenibacillus glucanolyticus]
MKKKKLVSLVTVSLMGSLLFSGIASAAQAGFSWWPTLREGSTGGYVSGLQANLWAFGQQPYTAIDGSFGSGTKTGVMNFQRYAGVTADGVAGSSTWNRFDYYSFYSTDKHWYLDSPQSSTYWTFYDANGTRVSYEVLYKSNNARVKFGYVN